MNETCEEKGMDRNNQHSKYEIICKEWLEIKRVSIKQSSYIKYKNIIARHLNDFFNNHDIDDINELIVANYILNKFNEKKISSSSIKSINYVLKSIYLYGEMKYNLKHVDFNYVKIPTAKIKNNTLSKEEENLLSQYCVKRYDSTSLAVVLGLYAGLRIGEICGLKWQDIDLTEGIININKTLQRIEYIDHLPSKTKVMLFKPKTGSSYRQVVIPDFINHYIENYYHLQQFTEDESDFFLLSNASEPIEPRTIQRRFTRMCKNLGFRTNFHTLRHTYATNCIKLGIDVKTVSEILGHSNVSTTLNRYVHPSIEFKKTQINKFKAPKKNI